MAKRISEATLAILSLVTIKGNNILLTCGQLDRKEYQAINEVLEHMGGKWNRGAKAHIYPSDPTDALEQILLTGEIEPPKDYGYFSTPPELAKRLVTLANIQPGMIVLEPSAGQGGLTDHLPEHCAVSCVELLRDNVDALEAKGLHILHHGDFLEMPTDLVRYDRVVMNPPFAKQADIDHVNHAWKFVSSGGRLVAIMSAGVLFRENRKTVDFRNLVEQHGGMTRNPAGSFKESGTMVETVMLYMDKP